MPLDELLACFWSELYDIIYKDIASYSSDQKTGLARGHEINCIYIIYNMYQTCYMYIHVHVPVTDKQGKICFLSNSELKQSN